MDSVDCDSLNHSRSFYNGILMTQPSLMSSLLQLPTSGPSQPPAPGSANEASLSTPGPASNKGSLDTMLGLLQSDLSRQGVPTQAKGLCSSCNKPIAGQVSGSPLLILTGNQTSN